MALDFSAFQPFLLGIEFVGIGLLGLGFLDSSRRSHILRAVGWILFGLYWPFQAPEFFNAAEADPINGWFTILGPLFLVWIAWHEWRSFQWREDPAALRWFAGASFIAALTYFVIFEIPGVQQWIILQTAVQSNWLLGFLFGVQGTVVQDTLGDAHIFLNGGTDYAVTVVLACTAIQSMMIFVGAIICLKAPWRRQAIGLLLTVPTIYFLNLFRNAGIVYGYKILNWSMFGIDSFDWMHSYVGKIGSLLALIGIALAVFWTLPELHSNILDLFDLRKRRAPGFFKKPPTPDAPAVIEST